MYIIYNSTILMLITICNKVLTKFDINFYASVVTNQFF